MSRTQDGGAEGQFSVSEVAHMMGIATSTLRYYEAEGILRGVGRSPSGRRRYSAKNMEACRVIECLKRSGLSLKEIKAFMDLCALGDATLNDRLDLFRQRREAVLGEMAALQEILGVLDFKTWYYEQAVAAGTEQTCRDLPWERTPSEHRDARSFLAGIPPRA